MQTDAARSLCFDLLSALRTGRTSKRFDPSGTRFWNRRRGRSTRRHGLAGETNGSVSIRILSIHATRRNSGGASPIT
jgi:hypothetical protein